MVLRDGDGLGLCWMLLVIFPNLYDSKCGAFFPMLMCYTEWTMGQILFFPCQDEWTWTDLQFKGKNVLFCRNCVRLWVCIYLHASWPLISKPSSDTFLLVFKLHYTPNSKWILMQKIVWIMLTPMAITLTSRLADPYSWGGSPCIKSVRESCWAGQPFYSSYKRKLDDVACCQLKLRWQNVRTQLSGNRWATGFFWHDLPSSIC